MKKPLIRSSLTKFVRFRAALKEHFFLRFHMILILTGVFASGLILSKLFLEAGVRSMLVRYPIVLVFSYLMFFVFIKLWLFYIRRTSGSGLSDAGLSDAVFVPDVGHMTAVGTAPASITPGGGDFGGGGSSGDFSDLPDAADTPGEADSVVSGAVASQAGGSSSLSQVADIDLDDGGIVLIVLGILLVLILGVGVYLVYAAPAILTDAAVQVFMASSLYKASKRMDNPDWVGSIFRATWIPFAIVIILTIGHRVGLPPATVPVR